MPATLQLVELADLAAIAEPVTSPGFSSSRIRRLTVFAPAAPSSPRPLLAGTENFAAQDLRWRHRHQSPKPAHDVACYFLTDAIIGGRSGQIWIDNQLVVTDELLPRYEYHINLELPHKPAQVLKTLGLPIRTVERPCVVLPGDKEVYGHFLIETLPAFLTARRALANSEFACAYLLPIQTSPWLPHILGELGVTAAMIEFYDKHTERILLRQAILPTMAIRENGFHPGTQTLLSAFLTEVKPLPPPRPAPRLFLARSGFASYDSRQCMNEDKLVHYATTKHGFTAIAMEKLPWRQQIGLFAQARIILGQYGSALHGALFSPPATVVACLGVGNAVQSEIAALRGQQMAGLTEGFEMKGNFTIDEKSFANFLGAVCGEYVAY